MAFLRASWGSKRALAVFLLAFGVTTAELCWWVTFNLQETAKVAAKQTQLLMRDCALAQELWPVMPHDAAWLAQTFPDLVFDDVTGNIAPRPHIEAARALGSRAHVRMFVAEGAFFFFMVVLGAAIIMRTIRREVGVVRQQANFLNAVTHELKSPLAAMRLYIETLERRRVDPETLARYVATLRAECDRLEVLVGHVLTLARLEQPQAPSALAPGAVGKPAQTRHDLNVVVRQVIAQESQNRRGKGPPIVHERLADGPLWVSMAEASLNTVMRNLLDNACKYGANSASITVRTGLRDNRVFCEVQDAGIGLAAQEQARVFERFYRVGDEMVRRHEGSGLGLYLVRLLLAEDAGTIGVSSAGLGEGATFTVSLPLAAAPAGVSS